MVCVEDVLPLEKRTKYEKFICVFCLICELNADKLGLVRTDDKIGVTQKQLIHLIQKQLLLVEESKVKLVLKELGITDYLVMVNDLYKPSKSAWEFYDLYKSSVKSWEKLTQDLKQKEGVLDD